MPSVTTQLPDDLHAFLRAEQARTGRNASEILRLALMQRRISIHRYLEGFKLLERKTK